MKPISPKIFITSVLLVTFVGVHCLSAQSGSLAPSFGIGGVATADVGSGPSRNAAIDSQGRIVMLVMPDNGVGQLARFHADGTTDETFGPGGVVNYNWSQSDFPFMMALQNDAGVEKIILAGSATVQTGKRTRTAALRVDRYLPDGSVDTTFGNRGTAVHQTGYALAVAVQTDGKILTVGDAMKLVRLNVNGSLDNTFGNSGTADISIEGRAIAVQSDGGIVVSGSFRGKGNKISGAVARFNSNGSVDNSFGASGRATVPSSSNFNVAVDPLGRIVVGGHIRLADNLGSQDYYVARLTSGGQLDGNFGSGGYATHDVLGTVDTGNGLALQSDGKIIVGGNSLDLSGQGIFSMARFNDDGTVDAGFGDSGGVAVDPLPLEHRGSSSRCVLVSGDKIIMPGFSYANSGFVHYATVAQFFQ